MALSGNSTHRIMRLALGSLLLTACGAPDGKTHDRGSDRLAQGLRAEQRRYIVVLRDSDEVQALDAGDRASSVQARVAALRERHSFESDHVYTHALRGFAARMSLNAATALQADPDVAYVEQDFSVYADATQTGADWGLDRLDTRTFALDGSFNYDATGQEVHAYVIDSGIDAAHPDFGSRVEGGATWVADGNGTADCNGHGTHVAGTIGGTTYGVAKKVLLHPLRTMNCSGSGLVSWCIGALDWVVANGARPAVVNMSLGSSSSAAQNAAVANTVAAGIVVVVSAGNDAVDACTKSPASEPSALTVGASAYESSSDVIAGYSNWGSCVDVFAPGSTIQSDYPGGGTAYMSGTSMASPHVAGAVAQYLEKNPQAMPTWVAEDLLAYSTQDVISGSLGGAPNRLLFTPPVPSSRPGGDRTVSQGAAVMLDGSASTSSQGTITKYAWTQTSGPAVALAGSGTAKATFTAPADSSATRLTFRLRVIDAAGIPASNGVTITVAPPPVANAGPAQTVTDGTTVTLDGTASTGAIATWSWTQTAGPSVALAGATTSRPTFVAPVISTSASLTFRLTVSDAGGGASSATVTITVQHVNRPPVARVGGEQTVSTGASITLDGRASSDPDGTIVVFAWAQTSGPAVVLSGGSTARPSFVTPAVTSSTGLSFRLTVTDDSGASASASTTVTVIPLPSADAGAPQTVTESAAVTLDGSASSGSGLRYGWSQTAGPAVALSGGTSARPTFTAPAVNGTTAMRFLLTVTDTVGVTSTAPTTVSVVHVNRPPLARAGATPSVGDGTTVTLDGSASSDPDGTIATYSWSQTAGPSVVLTGASLPRATFTAPTVAAPTSLVFQLSVTDDTGATSSASVNVSVVHVNRSPVANAGYGQSVGVGQLVQLDGSASSDSDGIVASYSWLQQAGPSVTLSAPGTARPSFTAPTVTTAAALVFRLTVTDDGGATSSAVVPITVIAPPIANAGPTQTANEGTVVTLDGSLSAGDITGYTWTEIAGPSVLLIGSTTPRPTFVAPAVVSSSALTFQLTLTDTFGQQSVATTTVTVLHLNRAPIANAGAAQSAVPGALVALDGTASSDPDGSVTSYSWLQLSGPTVTVAGATTVRPTFVAPAVTSTTALSFRLAVTDNVGAGSTADVVVTVSPAPAIQTPSTDQTTAASTGGCSSAGGSALGFGWLALLLRRRRPIPEPSPT